MKKILLLAILALSVNVFAQGKLTAHQKSGKAENVCSNIQNRMMEVAANTPGMNLYFMQHNKLQAPEQSETTPLELVDSTLTWKLNISDNSWKKRLKTIHIQYDNKNRRSKDVQQAWKGTAWADTIQNTYSWDATSTVYTTLSKTLNGSTWVNKLQVTLTMDAKGNVLSYVWQSWNGSAWVNVMKFLYIYDGNNNVLNEIFQSGNGALWINSLQTVYTYLNNNKASEQDQSWNPVTSLWENSTRKTFTYDANHNQTSLVEQNWNPDLSLWVDVSKATYTYDGNNLTTEINQEFGDGTWHNYSQVLYTNLNGNVTKETGQYWDVSTFTDAWQKMYTYNAGNKLTSELDQDWDSFNSVWINNNRYTYTYDAKNNQTMHLAENWDGSLWKSTLRDLQTYDANSYTKGKSHKVWNTGGAYDLFSGDSTYNYYHEVVTGLSKPVAESVSVYPNPSQGKFTISSNSSINFVEVYNLSGKRLYRDFNINLSTSNEIDLTGFAKGIYLLKIHKGTKIYNNKVVIQ